MKPRIQAPHALPQQPSQLPPAANASRRDSTEAPDSLDLPQRPAAAARPPVSCWPPTPPVATCPPHAATGARPGKQAMPPPQMCCALASLRSKVNGLPGLTPARRGELLAALAQLELDLMQRPPSKRVTVYVMEGATGLDEALGRASTDPDENIALLAIAALAKLRGAAAVVAVPDEANRRHTLAFLAQLGATATSLNAADAPRPGCVEVVSLDDAPTLEALAERNAPLDVVVLGPPLGSAELLLRRGTQVRIMGSATERAGTLDAQSLSTNTQETRSANFVLQAIRGGAKTFPSKTMGPALSLPLAELALGTSVVTSADKRHWARNTQQQFLGTAPHRLLAKRLAQSGAGELFATGPAEGDAALLPDTDGRGLATTPFLQRVSQLAPNPSALAPACARLGTGYEVLMQQEGAALARSNLREIVEAHCSERAGPPSLEARACRGIIAQMDDAQARHAFVALALYFHSLYAEKTMDGWRTSKQPGQQWRAAAFVDAYLERPGRQIPYDALVVLEPIFGLQPTTSAQTKAVIADKLLLLLWTELAA